MTAVLIGPTTKTNKQTSAAERSGNLRNDLKKDILTAVSNIRKEFATLRSAVEDKNKLIVELQTSAILKALQAGEGSNDRGEHGATSVGRKVNSDLKLAVPTDRTRKLY
jgi:hypothetical protein